MFLTPGSLKDFLPVIERIARGPGRTLVGNALVIDGLLIALLFALGGDGGSLLTALLVTVLATSLTSTLIFAWRRRRLKNAVEEWERSEVHDGVLSSFNESSSSGSSSGPGKASNSNQIIVVDESGQRDSARAFPDPPADDRETIALDRQREAAVEAARLRETWMPRIEAAQRSAIAAAGGLVNAPYLKDDLRITLVSGIITFLSIPVGALFAVVAFLTLIS